MRPTLLMFLCVFLAAAAVAQTAPEWVESGDVAARNDRHQEAIAAYSRALALDPSLHASLRVRLARQHLWAGEHDRAVELLREHLREQPDDCEARNDLGLALSWSDRLDAALAEYRIVAASCPALRNSARLRQALVLRWQDRPSAARSIYESLTAADDPAVRREAEEGLAFVDLMIDANRSALRRFTELDRGTASPASDGLAIAHYRLGNIDAARRMIEEAELRGALSRDLRDLREPVQLFDRPQIRAGATAFRDADGTQMRAFESGFSKGWRSRGRAEVAAGWSSLGRDAREVETQWIEVAGEHRWSAASATRARLRASRYDDWNPWSGEIGWVATPRDGLRVDLALARLLVSDNFAAIDNRLHGDFLSAGFDRALHDRFSLSASADLTRWSAGNRRVRVRVAPARVFEGVPRVTIEWPTLMQFYDEPFAFELWSPERYVETGPGVNVYRRWRRVWNLSAYVRGGAQREESEPWRWLGVIRLAAERDLRDAWALRVRGGWSNSNLAGSSGFRRTSVEFEILRRF